ncbi:deoxycytidyl transferase [Malassezia sp. CBS 17886]|nr:deoxycytidyl transferase [Malassezia sp. CBS 17886]
MRNKRAKLNVQQNALLDAEPGAAPESDALRGCVIYINGRTDPPYAELRRLVILHGGVFMAYLDQKTPCTHIVASSLTPKKCTEFRRYRVVLPGWVLASIRLGHRADWTQWRCPDTIASDHAPAFRAAGGLGRHGRSPAGRVAPHAGGLGDWRAAAAQTHTGNPALAAPEMRTDAHAGTASPPRASTSPTPDTAEHRRASSPAAAEAFGASGVHRAVARVGSRATPGAASPEGTPPPSVSAENPYASQPSNRHAARLMSSPAWRAQHTAASSEFLAGFYAASRLHHLSTWKSSLQELVASASREANLPATASALPAGMERVLMHIDFDAFFVSIGLREYPALRDKAVVVCHASGPPGTTTESSTSEVASSNYVSRQSGIKNGMSLGQARRLSADVVTIPYTFDAYHEASLQFYTVLLDIADTLQVVSVDEAFIDVSWLLHGLVQCGADGGGADGGAASNSRPPDGTPNSRSPPPPASTVRRRFAHHTATHAPHTALAEAVRDAVRAATGCEVSIGVGANILQARLATRRAKPAGAFHLAADAVPTHLAALDVRDLWGVGWSLCDRFRAWLGTTNIGALLAQVSEEQVVREFGPRQGRTLWDKVHGRDVDQLVCIRPRQTVGSHVSWGVRLADEGEYLAFVRGISAEVAQRAVGAGVLGSQVSVQLMKRAPDAPQEPAKFLGHGVCVTLHRSARIPAQVAPTNDAGSIERTAVDLLRRLAVPPRDVRGLSVSLGRLVNVGELQRGAMAAARGGDGGTAVAGSSSGFQVPFASQLDMDAVADLPPTMQARVRSVMEARGGGERPALTRDNLDPAVLAEIPSWLRDEVLAQLDADSAAAAGARAGEGAASATSGAFAGHDTLADVHGGAPMLPQTPTKRRAPHALSAHPLSAPATHSSSRRAGFGQELPWTPKRASSTHTTPSRRAKHASSTHTTPTRRAKGARAAASPGGRPLSAYLSPRARGRKQGAVGDGEEKCGACEEAGEGGKKAWGCEEAAEEEMHAGKKALWGDAGESETAEGDAAEREAAEGEVAVPPPWDQDVFRSLPRDVQADVYAEHLAMHRRRGRRLIVQDRMADRTAAGWRRHAAESALLYEARIRTTAGAFPADDPVIVRAQRCHEPENDAPAYPRASLVETTRAAVPPPLSALRTSMTQWFEEHADGRPPTSDVQRLQEILVAWAARKPAALDRAQGVLAWWAYLLQRAGDREPVFVDAKGSRKGRM